MKRTLILDQLPSPDRASKDVEPATKLSGVTVARYRFVQALLDYGTYEHYFYFREAAPVERQSKYQNGSRLIPVDFGTIGRLRQSSDLILFTLGHHISKYVPLRELFGRQDWPICGVTHGLDAHQDIPSYVWGLVSAHGRHDAIVCTSSAAALTIQKIYSSLLKSTSLVLGTPSQIRVQFPVIPLGIQERHLEMRLPDVAGCTFVYLGRLSVDTKADLRPLIRCFLGSNEFDATCRLVIAGSDPDGKESAALAEYASHFEHPERVRIYPNISSEWKQAILDGADVFIALSDTFGESFGLSVLEGMEAGLPVVASDWDGYRDLVEDGHSGFLIPSYFLNDTTELSAISLLMNPGFVFAQSVVIDLDRLQEAMVRLSRNPDLRRRMGEAGRRMVHNRFTWQQVIQQYEALWEEQIEIAPRCAPQRIPSRTPAFFDYGTAFSQHASQSNPDALRIFASPGDSELFRTGHLFPAPPIAGYQLGLDNEILETVRGSGSLRVDEVACRFPDTSNTLLMAHLGRLLKHGVLRFEGVPPSQTWDHEYEEDHVHSN